MEEEDVIMEQLLPQKSKEALRRLNMRFPHVISENTRVEYDPSELSRNLVLEQNRTVFPENLQWGDDHVPSLATTIVKAISANFENQPIIDQVFDTDKDQLLEIISIKLPLELVIPLTSEEVYWKRRYTDEFGLLLQKKRKGWTWKQLYIERYIRKIVEEAEPQYNDENEFETITKLCSPFVKQLIVTQLQRWLPPRTLVEEERPEYWDNNHINFNPILKELTEIEELSITIGMNSVRENFCWDMFKFTALDCERIGTAILHLTNLTKFRFHRCKMEDSHCRALMRGCVQNTTLIELDLSHCAIGDKGALCVAKLLTVHPTLESLKLNDNKIGTVGAEGIGFALLQDNSCPLKRLELKSNTLGHEGFMGILRMLVRSTKPSQLFLAACMAEEETPLRIAQMINLNQSLEILDISSNWFGEEGGELLVANLKNNQSIKWLDVRETDITPNQFSLIQRMLKRNRNEGADDDEELIEEEVEGAELVELEEPAGEDEKRENASEAA